MPPSSVLKGQLREKGWSLCYTLDMYRGIFALGAHGMLHITYEDEMILNYPVHFSLVRAYHRLFSLEKPHSFAGG